MPFRPVAALFLTMLANQSGSLVLSPILVDVARDFHVSTAAAGQLRSVSGFAAGCTALAFGALVSRFGLRAVVLGGLVTLAAASGACAAAPVFAVLAVAQIGVGIALGILLSGGVAGAAVWVPREHRSRALAWAFSAQAVAWVVGMPLVGLVGGVSWRLAWLALPLAASLIGLAAVARLPRPPAVRRPATPIRALVRHRGVAVWSAGELLAYSGWTGILVYVGALLVESYGLSLEHVGLVLGLAFLAYFPGTLFFRRWVDDEPRALVVVLAGVGAVLAVLIGAVRPSAWVTIGLLGAFVFINAGRTIAGSSLGLDAAPEAQASVTGVRTSAAQLGYLVGAAVGGLALHFGGYAALGIALATIYVLSAAPHLALVRSSRARVARSGA